MQRINFNANYFFRYIICFIGSAILYYGFPMQLAWPLKMALCFFVFTLYLLLHSKSRLICGTHTLSFKQLLKPLQVIWLWQLLALVTSMALTLIIQALLSQQNTPFLWQETFFTVDLYAKLCVAASITAIIACLALKPKQTLTIVPLFNVGAHAASPLVIFGNTWLREASCTLGIIGFCASSLFLVISYFHSEPISLTAILVSSSIAFSVFKNTRLQRMSRQWCQSGHFAWTLMSLSGIFLSTLCLLNGLLRNPWLTNSTFFSIHSSALFLSQHADLLFQSLWMLSIAPLIFRTAPYCRGMSVRTAILGQCLNPYILLLIFSHHGHSWILGCLTTFKNLPNAMPLLALSVLISSGFYLNSTWFAHLLECLFSHQQSHAPARMRPFFSRHLQLQLLLWFMVFSLKLNAVALIFISTVAAGTLLAYFYFYCFFWARTKNKIVECML